MLFDGGEAVVDYDYKFGTVGILDSFEILFCRCLKRSSRTSSKEKLSMAGPPYCLREISLS